MSVIEKGICLDIKKYFEFKCKTCGSTNVEVNYIAEGYEIECNDCKINFLDQQCYCVVEKQ